MLPGQVSALPASLPLLPFDTFTLTRNSYLPEGFSPILVPRPAQFLPYVVHFGGVLFSDLAAATTAAFLVNFPEGDFAPQGRFINIAGLDVFIPPLVQVRRPAFLPLVLP